jgi:hypothetical protein
MQARSGLLGSSFASSQNSEIESKYASEYSACESQWAAYESAVDRYGTCVSQPTTASVPAKSLSDLCAEVNGVGSFYDKTLRDCSPSNADRVIAEIDKCEAINGEGSRWDSEISACTKGSTQHCREMFGKNAYAVPGSTDCIACKTGYVQQPNGSCSLEEGKVSLFKPQVTKPVAVGSAEVIVGEPIAASSASSVIAAEISPVVEETFIQKVLTSVKSFWGRIFGR